MMIPMLVNKTVDTIFLPPCTSDVLATTPVWHPNGKFFVVPTKTQGESFVSLLYTNCESTGLSPTEKLLTSCLMALQRFLSSQERPGVERASSRLKVMTP